MRRAHPGQLGPIAGGWPFHRRDPRRGRQGNWRANGPSVGADVGLPLVKGRLSCWSSRCLGRRGHQQAAWLASAMATWATTSRERTTPNRMAMGRKPVGDVVRHRGGGQHRRDESRRSGRQRKPSAGGRGSGQCGHRRPLRRHQPVLRGGRRPGAMEEWIADNLSGHLAESTVRQYAGVYGKWKA